MEKFSYILILLLTVTFHSLLFVEEGHSNDGFFDGKVTLSDAIYTLRVVAGASSPPAVTDLTGEWEISGSTVEIADYTSAGQTPVVINFDSGPWFTITVHSGNVFGGSRDLGPDDGTSYYQGVVQGDQIFIQERNAYSIHHFIGTYTRNEVEEKIEGIIYGYDDDHTPGVSSRVGEFIAIKSILIQPTDP